MNNIEDIKKNKILNKKEDKIYNIKKYKNVKEFSEDIGKTISVDEYKYSTCAWLDCDLNYFKEKSWKDLTKDKKQYTHNK